MVSIVGDHSVLISSHSLILCVTGGATSRMPSVPSNQPPTPNVNEKKHVKLLSYVIDPAAAYKPGWKSILHASTVLHMRNEYSLF